MKSRVMIAGTMLLLALLLTSPVMANGNGNVTIKLNTNLPSPLQNILLVDEWNMIEIWVQNDAPLYQISLGFKLDNSSIDSVRFRTPYGNRPIGGPYYIQEYGDAVNKFDVGGLQVTFSERFDSLYISGIAQNAPLPAHNSSTKVYDLAVWVFGQPWMSGEKFACIDNIVFRSDGQWLFDDGTPYAPNFAGQPNSSPDNPDAPAECFTLTFGCKTWGDANGDCLCDISDAVFLIAYIFSGGPGPGPYGDVNFDGYVDISDVVGVIEYIFGK